MYRGNPQNTGVYETMAARTFRDKPNWIFRATSYITSPLVVGSGTLFFVTSPGVVHAVDAATGTEKWLFNAGEEVYNSPALGNGLLLLSDFGQKRLIALDVHTGQPVPINLERNDDFFSPPRIVDNLVLFGGQDSLQAIEIPGFRVRWSRPSDTGNYFWSCPAVANGVAYFAGAYGAVLGIDPVSGAVTGAAVEGAGFTAHDPVFHNGLLYLFASETNDDLGAQPEANELVVLDLGNRGEIQKFELVCQNVLTSPAVSGNTVHFGCNDGALYAMDLNTWGIRWRFQTGGPVESSPSIAEDLIYFGSDDGCLYVLNKNTGTLVSRFRTESSRPVRTSPAICAGVVYFADSAGSLYSWGTPLKTSTDNSVQQP